MMTYLRAAILFILLGALTLSTAQDAPQNISWTPPTHYTNGWVLYEQDLDFYTLYCNYQEFLVIDNIVGQHTHMVDFSPLGEGTHTCYLTVTDINGAESDPSNTANFTVGPLKPGVPQNFAITL